MNHLKLEEEIKKIIANPKFDAETVRECYQLLESGKILRDEGALEHFCVHFVPYNKSDKTVFIVHHKKSSLWIFPGGHIDKGETILHALNREVEEELGVSNPFTSLPEPFQITTLTLKVPRPTCTKHHDFWFLFETDGKNFKVDHAEFHEPRWLSTFEARKLVINQNNIKALDFVDKI